MDGSHVGSEKGGDGEGSPKASHGGLDGEQEQEHEEA
jgi:hypothetical protein